MPPVTTTQDDPVLSAGIGRRSTFRHFPAAVNRTPNRGPGVRDAFRTATRVNGCLSNTTRSEWRKPIKLSPTVIPVCFDGIPIGVFRQDSGNSVSGTVDVIPVLFLSIRTWNESRIATIFARSNNRSLRSMRTEFIRTYFVRPAESFLSAENLFLTPIPYLYTIYVNSSVSSKICFIRTGLSI